jgi:fibronectin type 3 domain-containing protein
MFARIVLIVLLITYAPGASAVTNQFIISQSVTNVDTTAPTIPTALSAVGVSINQINLTWSASSDAYGVTGYQIYRDNVFIATSTGISYSDTGLLESTSYTYNVTAFDASLNFSALSASAIGTTFSLVEEGDGIDGGAAIPRLVEFQVIADYYSAELTWVTSYPTRSIVRWGLAPEYEIASLSESSYRSDHATQLTNLTPNTKYYFVILAQNGVGTEFVLLQESFVTKERIDLQGPPNVRNLKGNIDSEFIRSLTWENPTVPDFSYVRIVRKQTGFPSDASDGELIYEGDGERFIDSATQDIPGPFYYAVFAYDTQGNSSSGAVVKIVDPGYIEPPKEISPFASTTLFRFQDLVFIQDEKEISYIGEEVFIEGTDPFLIKIPYGKLPEHLKTILVTIRFATDDSLTFSFLLRINKDKTAYEATIDALETEGKYPIDIAVFDYKERTITDVSGYLIVRVLKSMGAEISFGFWKSLSAKAAQLNYFPWILIFFLLLIISWLLSRRKK